MARCARSDESYGVLLQWNKAVVGLEVSASTVVVVTEPVQIEPTFASLRVRGRLCVCFEHGHSKPAFVDVTRLHCRTGRVVNRRQHLVHRATDPHRRDRDRFVPFTTNSLLVNTRPEYCSWGRLQLIDDSGNTRDFFPGHSWHCTSSAPLPDDDSCREHYCGGQSSHGLYAEVGECSCRHCACVSFYVCAPFALFSVVVQSLGQSFHRQELSSWET